jgi:dipeptidase E
MARLLLLSNSTNHGAGYLDHAMPEIRALLGPARRLLFVPFALRDQAGYVGKVRERFARETIDVDGLTADAAGARALESAEAVFVGGGNTFRLLKTLQDAGLLDLLGRRAREGMPYLGASAGINLASPSIKTTNDMPIVQPSRFEALRLVPFQINPHYLDPDPASRHMGETREDRIREFLEENDLAVVGLREGAWLRVDGGAGRVGGAAGARIFGRGRAPEERGAGAPLDDLLAAGDSALRAPGTSS